MEGEVKVSMNYQVGVCIVAQESEKATTPHYHF
jgi:hypothetical protein